MAGFTGANWFGRRLLDLISQSGLWLTQLVMDLIRVSDASAQCSLDYGNAALPEVLFE